MSHDKRLWQLCRIIRDATDAPATPRGQCCNKRGNRNKSGDLGVRSTDSSGFDTGGDCSPNNGCGTNRFRRGAGIVLE
jgi:hypothetical protein